MRYASILAMALLFCIPLSYGLNSVITDNAQVIKADEKINLESLLLEIKSKGIAEIAIVTVQSLDGKSIEEYSFNLAEGVLGDKEKNNGVLILVSVEDRQYRIEVGRGIEDRLTDAKSGIIGRTYLVPNFQKGEYGQGLYDAVRAIEAALSQDNASEYYPKETKPSNELIILFVVILAFIIISSLSQGRRKGKYDHYFDAAMIASLLFNKGRGGGGLGGFSGGGGFGGGSFGGGGAGGRW